MKETAPKQVQCRLVVGDKLLEFAMDGPLVALRPERKSATTKSGKGK